MTLKLLHHLFGVEPMISIEDECENEQVVKNPNREHFLAVVYTLPFHIQESVANEPNYQRFANVQE